MDCPIYRSQDNLAFSAPESSDVAADSDGTV